MENTTVERKGRFDHDNARLFLHWLLVGIPLGWGVWKVIAQSLALFGISPA